MKKDNSHFMSLGRLLSRSEMKQVIAGSDPIEDDGCTCSAIPCDYPTFTGCCCNDGSKTSVYNDIDGWLYCIGFCEQNGSSGCIAQ